MIRRLVPYSVLPLALIACCLASAPWLRAFPASVLGVPLFGTALLSVLVPVFVIGIGVRRLWLTALIDIVAFVFFTNLVALHEPGGFGDLWTGLVHGPSQLLTFALPLVSPRTLLVAPVALCWLCGAIVGECIGRGWQSVLPYASLLVTFGLSYAATAHAVTNASDGQRYDTILAGALLLAVLLLRAAQAWVEQDAGAETTEPEGILPLRSLAIGTVLSVAIAALAAAVVQAGAFTGTPRTPSRVPPIVQGQPLTPLSWVAGLRPSTPGAAGTELFKVTLDRPTSNYIAVASVDLYDGDGWSFQRTFRPSGGVIPADTDPQLRPHGPSVSQQYTIDAGAMTRTPWMPFIYRAQRVVGAAVDIDADSGMIVPSHTLTAGERYTVRSTVQATPFTALPKSALPDTSPPPTEVALPASLRASLASVVSAFAAETKTASTSPIPFLQALARDLRDNYHLAGSGSPTTSSSSASGAHFLQPPAAKPKPSRHSARHPSGHSSSHPAPSTHASSSASPTPTPTPSEAATSRTGGTSYADVLASILGDNGRSATPEQYATLVALVARELNVPARVVSGFRVPLRAGQTELSADTYAVTTADAWTWVEIPIRGKGWVVLDASPGTYGGPTQQQTVGEQQSPSPNPTPTGVAQVSAPKTGAQHPVAGKSKVPHSHGMSALALALIVIGFVVVVAAVALLVPVVSKRLRARRRRRRGDPRRRLLGAWQEGLDVLVESGLPELGTLTSAEVAAATGDRFGGEPAAQARYLGDAANVALFSPTSWIGPAEADAAWRAQAVLRKGVRRRLSLRDRFNASLRYHRVHRARPLVGPTSWTSAARARTQVARTGGRHSQRRLRRTH